MRQVIYALVYQKKSPRFILKFFLGLLLVLSLKTYPRETTAAAPDTNTPITYQYAIFYMETEGEFVVPVEVDAPAIYSWSEPGKSIKGDIAKIWQYLGITSTVEYSFTNIENELLNHLASKGWILKDLEITSVASPLNSSFRTAYRYIFKKEKPFRI